MYGGGGGGATPIREPTTVEFSVHHQPDILLSCSPSHLPPSDVFVFQINQAIRVEVFEFSEELRQWQLQRTENRRSHSCQYFIIPFQFIREDDEARASAAIRGMLGAVGVSWERGPTITKEIYSAAVRWGREYEDEEGGDKRIPILVDVVSVHHDRIAHGNVDRYEEEYDGEYDEEEGEGMYQEEEDEDECRIIPATESLIRALEKVKVAEEEVVCAICLEEMKVESEGSKMPCKHIFHETCIAKWLGSNSMRVCPLCRCQMPSY